MRRCRAFALAGVLAPLAVLLLAGCGDDDVGDGGGSDRIRGSGDVITDTRPVDDFTRIVLAGEGDVLLDAGSEGQIEIETDDNLLTHVESEVSGDTLTISTERGVDIDPTDGVTYRLGCPDLTAVTLTGAGTIELDGCTTTGALELELSGAGAIVAPNLDATQLRASLFGVGSIDTDGRTERLDVVLSGVADFEGGDLRAIDATVDSTGVGATVLWVSDSLDIRLAGTGDVQYFGEPQLTQTVTGLGAVESLGVK